MWKEASVFHLTSGSHCDSLPSIISALAAHTEFVNLQEIVNPTLVASLSSMVQSDLDGRVLTYLERFYPDMTV